MANGHDKIRSGHAVAPHGHRKRDSCATGGFYKSPSAAAVVDSSEPLQISWDTSCLDTTAVDIYLFAPLAPTPRIHIWQNVDYAYGRYNATLQPAWWNSTKSVSLQLEIIESGMPTFMATLPIGPMWNATYGGNQDASTSSDTASGSIAESVNNVPKQGLSKGKVAAAVIMTLLAVAGIVAGVYIWRSRKRGQHKRKRFSVAVDKRMSTISTDWKSVTTAGATHAIRNSVYSGDRTSSIDGGQPDLYSAADRQSRVSRVSFAPETRPTSDYRRTRAFHTGHLPPLPDSMMSPAELSPTQTIGPFSLSLEDVHAHMWGQDETQPSFGTFAPLYPMPEPELPTPPAPVLQAPSAPQSPILGAMPMPSIPGSTMSPDDMLRAYAERSFRSPPPTSATPPPLNGNGMRQLYSENPTTVDSFGLGQGVNDDDAPRGSFAVSEESRYGVENAEHGSAM
ncbi:uncharacterized protein B0H18DRAFT_1094036 [Fomitopsis serialis]|uniref:uncharacterized protein n=1 Tax=Fomitopsis serialis TaxID=139415 RepID=UPI00200806E9|nr:uncharacterized protein B0H18DRAFT_1094036 [Neoantrodia serialis]KAH9929266.1 hypothetical protein B0H18DRAFT_1094036 [Neoantrodia serialis]